MKIFSTAIIVAGLLFSLSSYSKEIDILPDITKLSKDYDEVLAVMVNPSRTNAVIEMEGHRKYPESFPFNPLDLCSMMNSEQKSVIRFTAVFYGAYGSYRSSFSTVICLSE